MMLRHLELCTRHVSIVESFLDASLLTTFTIWSIIYFLRFHIKIGYDSPDAWIRGLMKSESNRCDSGSDIVDFRQFHCWLRRELYVSEVDTISPVAAIRRDVSPLSPLAVSRHNH